MLLSSKINEISYILGSDTIIVEGIRDRQALNKFGINNVVEISGKPLIELADSIAATNRRNITILTDFDEDGEQIKSQLTNYLSYHGIKPNAFARNRLRSLFKIQKIEELTQFTKFMEDDYTGKASPIYDKIFYRSRIHNRRRGGKTGRNRSNIRSD